MISRPPHATPNSEIYKTHIYKTHNSKQPVGFGIGSNRYAALALLAIATIAISFAQRPDQFWHPYLWDEEGLYTLRFYVEDGWKSVFHPMAGHLIIATKLVDLVAFQISILWAPEIATALAVLLTFGVVAAIAFSPTYLRWRFPCALAVLTIPTDAEVFSTGAYAFWWAGLLLLLVVLWRAVVTIDRHGTIAAPTSNGNGALVSRAYRRRPGWYRGDHSDARHALRASPALCQRFRRNLIINGSTKIYRELLPRLRHAVERSFHFIHAFRPRPATSRKL